MATNARTRKMCTRECTRCEIILDRCNNITYQAVMAVSGILRRFRLDRVGVLLSGLCAVHCVAGLVLVTVLGLSGGVLLDPAIHEVGLVLAVGIGAIGLGAGVLRHRRIGVLVTGLAGLALMATAMQLEHGPHEALLTIAGVALLASAHWKNLRHAH